MPVPAVLEALEPDFLPVLLGQIEVESISSPGFANALQDGSAQLDQLVDGLEDTESASTQARRLTNMQVAALIIIVVVNIALFCTDGWDDV